MGNRRSRGVLSSREERMVEAFIDDICHQLSLDIRNPRDARYYRNIGWVGFLEVYRNQPDSFRGHGRLGWGSAALAIHEKLLTEKRAQEFSLYHTVSLEAPISAETETPRIELLGSPRGDHQNSVCFQDYLERLTLEDSDAGFLARCLINKDTLDEVRLVYQWSSPRVYRAFNALRSAMEEYLRI